MRTTGKYALVAAIAIAVAATIFFSVSAYNAGAVERKYREEIRQLELVKLHDGLQLDCIRLQAEIGKFQRENAIVLSGEPAGPSPLRDGAPAPAAVTTP